MKITITIDVPDQEPLPRFDPCKQELDRLENERKSWPEDEKRVLEELRIWQKIVKSGTSPIVPR